MSGVARPQRWARPRLLERPRIGAARPALAVAAFALLLAASAVVRTRAVSAPFWIDEGLTMGISAHGFLDIPGVLRVDGSPPLYYELLHGWIAIAGRSEAATHALSLVAALLVVPAGFWLARTAFGARAGWACAVLCALNPLLSTYAQETRMYSLVALLSMLAAGAFVLAFVHERRRFAWLHAGALAALLYTHNWGIFYALVAGATWIGLVLAGGRGRSELLITGAIAFGVPLLALAPWLPTLLFQSQHTGAPWSSQPSLAALPRALRKTLGGSSGALAGFIALATAAAALVQARRGRELRAAAVLLALTVGTLVVAWGFSQHSPAWASRYLTILLGPALLLVALGVARAGVAGAVAIAIVAVAWWSLPSYHAVADKSNVKSVAASVAPQLRPGDLVVGAQPESVPVLRYYLGPRLRYANELGPLRDPGVMDWRNALARLRVAKPSTVIALADALPPRARIALVRPVTRAGGWRARWTHLVKLQSRALARAFASDSALRLVGSVKPGHRGALSTVRAAVYERSG